MNDVVSVLEAQTEALLRRVAREQETRTRALRDSAMEQAHAIVVRARQEARGRLRQAIEEERRQVERAVGDRRAALDTAARRAEQATLRELIERAWQRLPQSVAARWQDAPAREEWIRAACRCAADSLRPQSSYTAELDAQDAPDAGGTVVRMLGDLGLGPVGIHAVAGLGPGLRIRGGGACVDATVGGLLASRERVEAELLAECDRLLGKSAGESPA